MKLNLLTTIILPVFASCQSLDMQDGHQPASQQYSTPAKVGHYEKVTDIPLPDGFARIKGTDSLFADWLGQVHLKKDNRVFKYNGELKANQSAQFAVLDISVGNKDLQQCADAVMRLRAEFLYSKQRFNEIRFSDNAGKIYTLHGAVGRKEFDQYLEQVFSYCGTLSLEKQLHAQKNFHDIQPGDVLIKGGSPGHAVIVMEVATNKEGKKIYLLAQSYMPAQDIHILKNLMNDSLSPWYEVCDDNCLIYTPEWTFSSKQLRRW